jgi:hypothetical protein
LDQCTIHDITENRTYVITENQDTNYSVVAQQGDRDYTTSIASGAAVFFAICILNVIVLVVISIIRLNKRKESFKTHPRKDIDPAYGEDNKNQPFVSALSNAEDQPSPSIASTGGQHSLLNDGINDQLPVSIVSVYDLSKDQTLLSKDQSQLSIVSPDNQNQSPPSYYASVHENTPPSSARKNDQTPATIDNQSHASTLDQTLEPPLCLDDQASLSNAPRSNDETLPPFVDADHQISLSSNQTLLLSDSIDNLIHSLSVNDQANNQTLLTNDSMDDLIQALSTPLSANDSVDDLIHTFPISTNQTSLLDDRKDDLTFIHDQTPPSSNVTPLSADNQTSLSKTSLSSNRTPLLHDSTDDQMNILPISNNQRPLLNDSKDDLIHVHDQTSLSGNQTPFSTDNQTPLSKTPLPLSISNTDNQTPLSLTKEDRQTPLGYSNVSINDQRASLTESTDDADSNPNLNDINWSTTLVRSEISINRSGVSLGVSTSGACLEPQPSDLLSQQSSDSRRSDYAGRNKNETTRKIFSLPKENKKAKFSTFMRPKTPRRPKKNAWKSPHDRKSGSHPVGGTQMEGSTWDTDKTHVRLKSGVGKAGDQHTDDSEAEKDASPDSQRHAVAWI